MFKDFKIYLFLLILIILGFVFYNNRVIIKEYFTKQENIKLPEEIKFVEIEREDLGVEENNDDIKSVEAENFPSLQNDENINDGLLESLPNPRVQEINLAVPFTIQSPDQKWDELYKEGCEEACVLMVYSFLNNQNISMDSALKDIGEMIYWQIENWNGHFDLSATTTAEMAKEFYNLDIEIIELSSIEQIKDIIRTGYPLILPCAGRELKNPNFKQPGPLYHMLIVKGFTKDGLIITNDPGTRKGKDYVYQPDILWNAIADWDYNLKNPNQNEKVGIILK